MPIDTLSPENYYHGFEHGGWNLSLMLDALQNMSIHAETFDSLRQKEHATFLVLGSATSRNLDNIALMDKFLRPGRGKEDTAFIIDYNRYPLKEHQERIQFFAEWEEANKKSNPEPNQLLYPAFELLQADMKHLPLTNESVDVVVSDYTLNFLEDAPEVDAAFAEASRVLSTDGVMLMAISGNDRYPPGSNESIDQMNDMAQKELSGHLVINQLPMQAYIQIADEYNLELVAGKFSGADLLCGVFKKRAVQVPRTNAA